MPKFKHHDFPPLPAEASSRRSKRLKGKKEKQATGLLNPHNYATIDDLPDELILEILRYIPGIDLEDFQLATLLSLSTTNHRLHHLVTEKLYASYNSFFCEPYLFLRTVITNPHLAEFVQNANITYGKFAHCERERYMPTAQDKKIIKDGLKALGISDWKTWATDCNARHAELDTLHTAVLMYTPKLKDLSTNHGTTYDDVSNHNPKWIKVLKKINFDTASSQVHKFEHLQRIQIEVGDSTLMELAPVFRTPTLCALTMKGLLEYDPSDTEELQKRLPAQCNDIEQLDLISSFIHPEMLAVLLASPRGLRRLRYDVSLEELYQRLYGDEEAYADSMRRPTVLENVARQRRTLEHFSFSCDRDSEALFQRCFNLFEGLRNFMSLTSLCCPLGAIANANQVVSSAPLAQKLPPSLVNLELCIFRYSDNNHDVEALPSLAEMASMFATYVPNLKTILVHVEAPGTWLDYDWATLVEPFSLLGVELVVEVGEDGEDDGFSEEYESGPRVGFIDVEDLDVLDEEDSSRDSDEVSLYSN
ncbi:hypothetical protein EK21DRAFT_118423 [Setomelanomma holmii]|uniref:F-box domain-containing protein n=1 Tax=Setomelanomma holmii TaxID=210430 RepID=A0A9P4LGQ0_9PLEO|nr:hypothetical protein EK21DRAFT_118423 [Setomelanomma holmii]